MSTFKLPDLGEGLPDAEINKWHVKVGDEITADEPMVAMETAKAIVDVPAPHHGIITKLHGNIGDIIKTGANLIEITPKEEQTNIEKSDSGTVAGKIETQDNIIQEPEYSLPKHKKSNNSDYLISPAAINLIKSLNIDLSTIKSLNPQQKITVKNIKKIIANEKLANHEIQGHPLQGTRRTMAKQMAQAHANIVPVSIFDQVILKNWSKEQDITTLIIQALHTACQKEPALNAWFDGENNQKQELKEVNLGLAVDTNDGLFVPVIHNLSSYLNSKQQTLRTKINEIKDQVKSRTITPDALNKASITLSNFGMFSGRYATPIIVPPQVAILGCGQLHQQVVPINQEISIAWILPLSLTIDHRAVTGGEATRFLKILKNELTNI